MSALSSPQKSHLPSALAPAALYLSSRSHTPSRGLQSRGLKTSLTVERSGPPYSGIADWDHLAQPPRGSVVIVVGAPGFEQFVPRPTALATKPINLEEIAPPLQRRVDDRHSPKPRSTHYKSSFTMRLDHPISFSLFHYAMIALIRIIC